MVEDRVINVKSETTIVSSVERLVITGANGWVGRAALSLAGRCWGDKAPEKVAAFGSMEAEILVDGRRFKIFPLTTLTPHILEGAVVLHLSFLTKNRLADISGEAFLAQNAAIDSLLFNALLSSAPRGLFVASSGAARLVERGEGDLYGIAKLVQERRFEELGMKMHGSLLRGRIWSMAGPYINKPGAYALADFLIQGRKTGSIHINASKPVYRSYLHVDDVVAVTIFSLLSKRAPAPVIDLAGLEILEMQDVAIAAALAIGIHPARISRPAMSMNRREIYVGDWAPFRELALACDITPKSFAIQVADTLAYLDKEKV